jgi:hypothetical protein
LPVERAHESTKNLQAMNTSNAEKIAAMAEINHAAIQQAVTDTELLEEDLKRASAASRSNASGAHARIGRM